MIDYLIERSLVSLTVFAIGVIGMFIAIFILGWIQNFNVKRQADRICADRSRTQPRKGS